ncbi:MAG: hypothetical protein IJF41_03325 [Clostridia bacterium]|nr:hypothetical protein [Clostridia bacterium]
MEEKKEAIYQPEEAKLAIKKKFVAQGDFLIFEEKLFDEMLDKIVDMDAAYMKTVEEGDGFYDDDKAFDAMVKGMQEAFPENKMYMMRFVEDYMEYNEQYMDEAGLIDWE